MNNISGVLAGGKQLYLAATRVISILALLSLLLTSPARAQIRVACIGDSITFGATLSNTSDRYPNRLQNLLGSSYQVINYGVSGTTMLKLGDKPYWNQHQYDASIRYNAAKYIIMLGTNDSKPINWTPYGQNYPTDYAAMIAAYKNLSSHPKVYVCLCLPVYNDGLYGISSYNVENFINPNIKAIATANGATLIDTHAPFVGHPEYYTDGVHPNAIGAAVLAQTVYNAIYP